MANPHIGEKAKQLFQLFVTHRKRLRTYDRCVQNLEAELSIKPMAETQQRYERIRSSGE